MWTMLKILYQVRNELRLTHFNTNPGEELGRCYMSILIVFLTNERDLYISINGEKYDR